MIYYPIEKLLEADIDEILIVTGVDHMGDVVNLLGSGKDFKCRFTYKVQDEAGGIAQALGLAENFAGNTLITVLLGDNVFQDSIKDVVKNFKEQKQGAKLLLKEVHDPERYGVAEIKGNRITGIEEKPKKPKTNYCVTGIYMYDPQVFEMIKTLKPSWRDELEITDINNRYVEKGELSYDFLKGWWTDAGTFESLKRASELVSAKQ